jgi:hypothetical protein
MPMPVPPAAPTGRFAPNAANYGAVQGYADQAHGAARRYLDPQQQAEQRRFDQSLINKGIDPNSQMGKQMFDAQSRRINDANAAAAFGALQFGQGIQGQMADQKFREESAMMQHQLGTGQLDLARQSQDFGEMMGLEGIDFRNRQYADQGDRYQDQITMAMMGMTPVPGVPTLDPSGAFGTTVGSAGANQGFLGRLFGF